MLWLPVGRRSSAGICLRVTLVFIACLGAMGAVVIAPSRAHAGLIARSARIAVASRSKRLLAAQPRPLGVSGNWKLVLDSEFDGTKLDRTLWRPGWFGTGITGPINSNEIACYNSANATLPGSDTLDLSLTAIASRCKGELHPYTGAVLSTNPEDGRSSGGFAFTYGLVEARVYVPASRSHIVDWPAVMTLGQSWPDDGEDDILEGIDGTICARFHSLQNVVIGAGGCLRQFHGGWYTIAADWEPGSVTWYYNGARVGYTTEVTAQAMYLAIAYTASRKAPQLALPATLRVAYVRVWQHPGAILAGVDRLQF